MSARLVTCSAARIACTRCMFSSASGKRPTTPLGMLAWDAREEAARSDQSVDALDVHESVLERMANRKIRDAIESGDFDSLEGKGRPLPVDRSGDNASAFTSQSQTMLNKILSHNNITPEFITLGKAIREDLKLFDAEVEKWDKPLSSIHRALLAQRVESLNTQIRYFNKINRIPSMHVKPLDIDMNS